MKTKRVPVWLVWFEAHDNSWAGEPRASSYEIAEKLAEEARCLLYKHIEITGPHYPKVSA